MRVWLLLAVWGCRDAQDMPADLDRSQDPELVELDQTRLLRRTSLELRGVLPSLEELEAVEGARQRLAKDLEELVKMNGSEREMKLAKDLDEARTKVLELEGEARLLEGLAAVGHVGHVEVDLVLVVLVDHGDEEEAVEEEEAVAARQQHVVRLP